jgi:transposase
LKSIAPSRADMVVAVECLFTWYWLADLCAHEGLPFVLGHALSMKAIHGGKAKNDRMDARTIAVLLRGGMLPQAYVSPAAMRATRDLLRRRFHLTRQRAELLTPSQQTNRQDNLPEMGKKIASKAHRDGVAERLPDPAVQKSVEVALALIDYSDRRLSDIELTLLRTAQQHDAQALSRRQAVPGMGTILRVVWLYEMYDLTRCPRVQDFVSSCRLVKCAQESAGKRSGTSGAQLGHASRTWAFSEAAVLLLRNNPMGQKDLSRLEHTHGKGNALTIVAHKLARAVYALLKRDTGFARQKFLNGEGSGAGEPYASLDDPGCSLVARALLSSLRQGTRRSP